MEEVVIRFLSNLEWGTLLGILAIFAMFKKYIDRKLEKIMDILIDLKSRVHGLESSFNRKECCMIKDPRQMDKAE